MFLFQKLGSRPVSLVRETALPCVGAAIDGCPPPGPAWHSLMSPGIRSGAQLPGGKARQTPPF
ncbi:hypothetical protein ARMGADRAFT_1014536 [Armillaria gallica]|uniref:Uncharacterized protein n=1 Tax=Armillaria gallica TaxID=47427 RepID=A0A2H3DQ03_ARMGA|nr:hypothetical protein ARMGADRAFT_1014536 [Armillaria gallica]